MSEEVNNRLGTKITTLREAHHLTQQDLADRCQCDLETIVGLENGELPPSLAPLIKITRALGVRLGTLMDDDEALGPLYISSEQMEEVTRLKSLETNNDAGDLSYFSLAAGKPSRHMRSLHHHRRSSPARRATSSSATRARSGSTAWRARSRSSMAKSFSYCILASPSTTTPSFRMRFVPMMARRQSFSPSCTRRFRRGRC